MKRQTSACFTAVILSLFLSSASVYASDYGLSLSVTPKYLGEDFTLNASASPWFSVLINEQTDIYASAIVDYALVDEESDFRFDAGRTQLTYRAKPAIVLEAGRLFYSDIATLVGSGLFDGSRISMAFPFGRAVFGAYYSGLLNKERVGLALSIADLIDAADDDVYFAPSRVLISAALSSPSLFGNFGLNSEVLAQFDLRGTSKAVNSQYIILSSYLSLPQDLSLTLGLAASIVQSDDDGDATGYGISTRGEISYLVPSPLFDRLYLGGAWGSGSDEGDGGFFPIKGPNAGKVFTAPLRGIATVHGGYFVKLMPQLSADVSVTAFLRQGDGALDAEIDYTNDSAYIGTEAYASMSFSVSSELSLSMGTGMFFPSADAFVEDTINRFLFTATAIVSF